MFYHYERGSESSSGSPTRCRTLFSEFLPDNPGGPVYYSWRDKIPGSSTFRYFISQKIGYPIVLDGVNGYLVDLPHDTNSVCYRLDNGLYLWKTQQGLPFFRLRGGHTGGSHTDYWVSFDLAGTYYPAGTATGTQSISLTDKLAYNSYTDPDTILVSEWNQGNSWYVVDSVSWPLGVVQISKSAGTPPTQGNSQWVISSAPYVSLGKTAVWWSNPADNLIGTYYPMGAAPPGARIVTLGQVSGWQSATQYGVYDAVDPADTSTRRIGWYRFRFRRLVGSPSVAVDAYFRETTAFFDGKPVFAEEGVPEVSRRYIWFRISKWYISEEPGSMTGDFFEQNYSAGDPSLLGTYEPRLGSGEPDAVLTLDSIGQDLYSAEAVIEGNVSQINLWL
jgi:hypothetical protein